MCCENVVLYILMFREVIKHDTSWLDGEGGVSG